MQMSAATYSYLHDAWVSNPFDSDAAKRHSSYSGFAGGELSRLLETAPLGAFAHVAHDAFREWVLDPEFSCLAGRSAFHRLTYRFGAYEQLDDAGVTEGLARDLYAFATERAGFHSDFTSFVAVFRGDRELDEPAFEARLWSQLQRLHDLDARYHAWDERVGSNPGDPDFSFSVAGTAYFVVGMHPQASRRARRFAWPALVFNAHEQFEHLRKSGTLAGLKQRIRQREIALDGSVNANLSDYGKASDAQQYSGRATAAGWTCPFRPQR
jgi:FPC/CPF motif-containing protein YcgG